MRIIALFTFNERTELECKEVLWENDMIKVLNALNEEIAIFAPKWISKIKVVEK